MANELNLSLSITGFKTGIMSTAVGRALQSFLANMNGNFIAQGSVLANHLGNGSITGATNAFPIVITTSVAHGLTTGETVTIASVTGNTAANGTWVVTVLSATTFSIPTVGNAAYISGGTWYSAPTLLPLEQVTAPHYAFFYNADPVNSLYVQNGTFNCGSISGATNSNPITLTAPQNHGIPQAGSGVLASLSAPTVVISGVLGNLAANGTFVATWVSNTQFSVPISGSGSYTSGGVFQVEPVDTTSFLQTGEGDIVGLDPLTTLYTWCPVAACRLEYLIFSQ